MKKIAIAAAAAMSAAAAGAASVELYGIVDTGLDYTNKDALAGTTETFEMINGYNSGSRVGFKGKEGLGNGYAVSFILENGFSSDNGELGQDGRMFGREAQIKFHTPYGALSFGRAGTIMSGAGSLDVFGTFADALPGGWDGVFNVANYQGNGQRYDNMVTYVSPTAAGFTAYAQYSFANDTIANEDSDGVANERGTNRYVAFALSYANGPIQAVVAYDTVMYRHDGLELDPAQFPGQHSDLGDTCNLSVGGSYDFGFMRVSAYGQYVKGVRSGYGFTMWKLPVYAADGVTVTEQGSFKDGDGYNLGLGVQVPTSMGRFYVAGCHGSVDDNNPAVDGKIRNWNAMVAHEYDLSKRTTIYSGPAWRQVKAETAKGMMKDTTTTQVVAGLRHVF